MPPTPDGQAPPRVPAPPGMVPVPAGRFTMGSDHDYPEEAPAHQRDVDGFWMDRTPVTNAQFAAFVAATGHVTTAELSPDPADYPGADPALLVAGSLVFTPSPGPVRLDDARRWWCYVPGIDWRRPQGEGSTALPDHPVVHVSYRDAQAFARWAGKDLPTEAEWEYAARGGGPATRYQWGDELVPDGRLMANTWQGEFPWRSDDPDGFVRTSPVGSYPPNGFGLVDTIGNVWEWTASPATPRHLGENAGPHGDAATAQCCGAGAPTGRGPIPQKIIKGGSHLCAPDYCRRYRPAARQPEDVDSSTSHLGFRCVLRRDAPA